VTALDLVLLGLAISFDPLPITTFVVLLAARRGTAKGAAFLAGWILSLVVVVVVTLTATGDRPPAPATAPSSAAVAVKIAIGVVLLVVAVRQRRRMGQPKRPKKTPKWQAGVDSMSPLFAAGLAVFAQPWALLAAGAATVTEAKFSGVASAVALVAFCLIASASYLTLELLLVIRPERGAAFLAACRTWMDTHSDQVIVIGCLVLGAWLVGHGIYLIVT
jgi:hypothetical protein